jgi:hypothetical protein
MSAKGFDTASAYQAAFDTLLGAAGRQVCLYERTLDDLRLEDPARHAALRAFCSGGGGRRLDIMLDETDTLRARHPRLIGLLRDFGHVLSIRQADPDAARPDHAFVVADRRGVLKRFDKQSLRGSLDSDDPHAALLLQQEFDALWERAPVFVSATTLGL